PASTSSLSLPAALPIYAVVEVPGDAGPLLVGAHRAQAGEPAGVVDGQGHRLDEGLEELELLVGVGVIIARLDGQHADHGPPGGEHGVHAAARLAGQAGAVAALEVLDPEGALELHRPAERGREARPVEVERQPGALLAEQLPGGVGVVEEEDGGRVE